MALRSGYKGFKKLLPGLKLFRPGTLGIDNDVLIPELNKNFFPRSEQAVLGARNVEPQYTMASGTVTNGITVTYDANSVVNLNGTASADTYIGLRPRNTGATLPADARYKVSGRVSTDCFTFLLGSDGSTVASSATEEGSVFDYTSAVANFGLIIYVKNGTVLSNQKVYPMITLASDTDTSFSAPAMTNKELTDAVQTDKTTINAIITAATGATDFAAFKAAMEVITPVTRSLSKEAFPEDPAEVIEEKPVTRKTTTKKTVKEGE